MKTKIIYLSLFLLFFNFETFSQNLEEQLSYHPGHINCYMTTGGEVEGWHIPITNDTLKALIVFVNFPNPSGSWDPIDHDNQLIIMQHWSGNNAQDKPIWADSIICPTTTNIWHPSITGLIKESSHNKFFLIGDVFEDLYVFKNELNYYTESNGRGIGYAIREALEGIDEKVNYADYDKFDPWDFDNDNNLREPDGKVDFIFIAMRFTHGSTLDPSVGYNYSGIATLGGNRGTFGMYGPSSITLDGKQIMADFPGSGVIAEIHNRWEFGNLIHEYFQHYYFGRVHNDIMGAWNINGGTIPCASDREHLEWNTEGTCYEPSSNTTITLNDYVSQGDYIKIPHSSGTFYIEHRRRLSPYSSSNWHTWRWRADVPITPIQRDSGIFIYRKHSAHSFTTDQASGRFNWKTCNTRSLIDEPIFINTFQRQQSNRYSGIGTESLIKKPVYDLNCQRIY